MSFHFCVTFGNFYYQQHKIPDANSNNPNPDKITIKILSSQETYNCLKTDHTLFDN